MAIRQPTPSAVLYDWWRRSVVGERMPRFEDEPQPGYYRRRKVRGGPFLAVEIWMHQETDPETGELVADEELRAICNGELCNPLHVWTSVRPISLDEYDALTGNRGEIAEMAATMVAVDLGAMAPLTP